MGKDKKLDVAINSNYSFNDFTITTAICVEVESLKTTSFDSSLLNSSAERIPAKSFTSLGGTDRSGISCACNCRVPTKIKMKKSENFLMSVIYL